MVYFLSYRLKDVNITKVEESLRTSVARRHTYLDLQSAVSGVETTFLGYEKANEINLTRVRNSFERYLPKIIVKVDKTKEFKTFYFRLGGLSLAIPFVLLLSILSNIFFLSFGGHFTSDSWIVVALSTLFIVLTLIEVRLTKKSLETVLSGELE